MKTSWTVFFVLTVFSTFLAKNGNAEMSVFREKNGKIVYQKFSHDYSLSTQNYGLAVTQFKKFFDRTFSDWDISSKDLETRGGFHQDSNGITIRFIQRYNRIKIEGAELVVRINLEGKLKSLSSSLVTHRSLSRVNLTTPLSAERFFRIATQVGKYNQPELPPVSERKNEGLLIVKNNKSNSFGLVWQISLREFSDGSNARQFQIFVNGLYQGQIYKVRSLEHAWVPSNVSTHIYDSSVTVVLPNPLFKGVKVLENSEKTTAGSFYLAEDAKIADERFTQVNDFYFNQFNRHSYDNNGARIDVSVNVQRFTFFDPLRLRANAAWMGPWKMFVFGAGDENLGGFIQSLDVVGHEFTHAVIESTSALVYEGESGALNEHLADVFGEMIQQHYEPDAKPFLLGEGTLRGGFSEKAEALRDMLNPEKGLSAQPSHVDEIPAEYAKGCVPSRENDNCGVHHLSGIPNKAIAKFVETVGWTKAKDLIYRVATGRLRSQSNFADYRLQLLDECETSDLDFNICQTLDTHLTDVGI